MEPQGEANEYMKAFFIAKKEIEKLRDEKKILQEVHEEFKTSYEKMKRDYTETGKKLIELLSDKRTAEENYEAQIKHYRSILEQREKELQEVNSKSISSDPEMLRSKFTREIEIQFRAQFEAKEAEIEKLEAEVTAAKNSVILSKTGVESIKRDYDKQIADLKEKHNYQINDIMEELKVAHMKVDETIEKDQLRTLKREILEYQRKVDTQEKELIELRKERDMLKFEHTNLTLVRTKLVDEEEITKQTCTYEIERLTGKKRDIEEDLRQERERGLERQHKVEQLQYELDELKKKQAEIEFELTRYKRRLSETEEILKDREAELSNHIKRSHEDEKEKFLYDREEKARLTKEAEKLEAQLMQTSEEFKIERHNFLQQIQIHEKDKKGNIEEIKTLRKKIVELQSSHEAVKNNYLKALDESEAFEKELKKLQEKHRNLLNSEQVLMTTKDRLEVSIKAIEEEHFKLIEEKKSWNRERNALQTQLAELTQRHEKIIKSSGEELKKYKGKTKEYKLKVRQANLKLQQFATKYTKSQIENLPMKFRTSPPRGKKEEEKAPFEDVIPQVQNVEAEIAQTLEKHKKIAEKMGI